MATNIDGDEIFIEVETDTDTASEVFSSFKFASGNKQMRSASYVDGLTGFTIAIDRETFAVRLVPLRELA